MKARMGLCLAIFALGLKAQPATPSVEDIMARVAENQSRAEAARARYVYRQNIFHQVRKMNGAVGGEETREYVVTPTSVWRQLLLPVNDN